MKRGKPLQRRTPLRRRPLQQVAAEVTRQSTTSKQRRDADRRRDVAWRQEVLDIRGQHCRVTGCVRSRNIEVDHMIPRRPSTRWAWPNGLVLCREHHADKTAHTLLIDRRWLEPDQIVWLAEQGHAWWLPDGSVAGRHCTLFAPTEEGKPL